MSIFFFTAVFFLLLLAAVLIGRAVRPHRIAKKHARKICGLYVQYSQTEHSEEGRWEKTAEAYLRSRKYSGPDLESLVTLIRCSCEDFMARQDVLKTNRQKAAELVRRVLLAELSLRRQTRRAGEVERIHGLAEGAAGKFF